MKTQLHLALFRSLSLYPVATENIASQVTEFVYVCDSCKNLSPLLLLPPTGFEWPPWKSTSVSVFCYWQISKQSSPYGSAYLSLFMNYDSCLTNDHVLSSTLLSGLYLNNVGNRIWIFSLSRMSTYISKITIWFIKEVNFQFWFVLLKELVSFSYCVLEVFSWA